MNIAKQTGVAIREYDKRIAELEAERHSTDLLIARINHLEQQLADLQTSVHEACEVYAGMYGFTPETAPEGYCLRIIEQMYKALQESSDD